MHTNLYRVLGVALIGLILVPLQTFAAITFQSNNQETSGGNPITYSAVGIGTAAADRIVIVGVVSEDANLTSATIGGVNATIVAAAPSFNNSRISVIAAVVPTGTTADIVLTFNIATLSTGIGVYTDNGVSLTPYDTGIGTGSGSSPTFSTTVNVPASGFVLSTGFVNNDSATTYTWTGITKKYEANVRANARQSGGFSTPSAQSGYAVSAAMTGSSVAGQILTIAFQYGGAITAAAPVSKKVAFWW